MDWGDGRTEPTFGRARRRKLHGQPAREVIAPAPAPMAVVPVPAPTDPFANVRPRYVESSYPPHIDYSQLGGGASAFNICLVVALTALIMLGLAHVGPHFWDVVGTALEWVFGIALVIGFIALMTKYPNLARAVMAFSFLLIAVSWFVKEDDYDRRS